ncbi:hypothetical protein GJ496_002892 [Pomphorhynchus laevis]|nr:hypothetical protein GJ496_002892 [Pomphorhynchus laevis]
MDRSLDSLINRVNRLETKVGIKTRDESKIPMVSVAKHLRDLKRSFPELKDADCSSKLLKYIYSGLPEKQNRSCCTLSQNAVYINQSEQMKKFLDIVEQSMLNGILSIGRPPNYTSPLTSLICDDSRLRELIKNSLLHEENILNITHDIDEMLLQYASIIEAVDGILDVIDKSYYFAMEKVS